MIPTLIIGYGNIDRQDDGVAWHVLKELALRQGRPAPVSPDDAFDPGGRSPDLLFTLQLTPELAETIARYERVCFVDAHTGRIQEEVQITQVNSEFQVSPLTHHLTPETCLSLSETLYHRRPQASLVSIRGYEFGFTQSLSPRTAELAGKAAGRIIGWLHAKPDQKRANSCN